MKFKKFISELPKLGQKAGRRVGRGIGSGKGKTSAMGHKGQKSRAGYSPIRGFEGGQRTVTCLAKRGFSNFTRVKCDIVTTLQISDAIKNNQLANDNIIERKDLVAIGLIRKNSTNKIKLLLNKEKTLSIAFKVKLDCYSAGALKAVTSVGGECIVNSIPC